MQHADNTTEMWGFALNEAEAEGIRECLGSELVMKVFPAEDLPDSTRLEKEQPLLALVPHRVWSTMPMERRKDLAATSTIPRILILDETYSPDKLESLLEWDFTGFLKPPIKTEHIREIVKKAEETRNLYADIYAMTQEIYLERELLARKNEHLSFINRFISHASESLEPATILLNARKDLNMLLQVELLQAAVWTEAGRNRGPEAELLLAASSEEAVRAEWEIFLLESVARLANAPVKEYRITELYLSPEDASSVGPSQGKVIVLPLKSNGQVFGCVVLGSEERYNLGRDQVQLLNAAVKHLGLALRNAQLFSQVKVRAEYDGLTRVHNRQAFDKALRNELNRHQRYNQPLSLLLMDLDHFKSINDTFGHQAGDAVLKEIGEVLRNTVRSTDFAARYGGEEFVAILPQTMEDQARVLAERLRETISQATFSHPLGDFQVTMSIGIASLKPGALKPEAELLQEADQALYLAKANGRNMVIAAHGPAQQFSAAQ